MRPILFAVLVLTAPVCLADEASPAEAAAEMHVTMYKSPTCGCCEKWADHLRAHGFTVDSRPTDLMESIKDERGIPMNLRSCHTAHVGDYLIEGHVPAADIMRLLKDRPKNVRLLTVPGMPLGSPGMEHPQPQDFITIAVEKDGKAAIYTEHAAGKAFWPTAK